MTSTVEDTDSLLIELAKYAEVIHDALETEQHHGNRLHHLGHLAMAARIFVALQLPESAVKLSRIYNIERASLACKLPGDAAARIRLAWASFSPQLKHYLDARGHSESDAKA